jgi:DNA-binding NtrC family response regulator
MSNHILVIDDDPGIRDAFILALKNTGYQLDTAETGEEGIEKEQSKKYDLIFLDLNMPGMSGTEVLRKIRMVNKETPIYIITAFYKDFANELKGPEFELIKKPIRSDQILLVTRSVLEGPIAH